MKPETESQVEPDPEAIGMLIRKTLEGCAFNDYMEIELRLLKDSGLERGSLAYCDWLSEYRLRQASYKSGPGRQFVRIKLQQ